MKNIKSNYNLFLEPPAEFRGAPFWAWNGKLEKEELLRQIHIFKDMGMGGFFMHSRAGLQTEYLGKEWMELARACAEEAARLGMKAYLYDEDRWPSGTAGGLVTQNPRFKEKFMRGDKVKKADFNLLNYGLEYLCAFAVRLCSSIDGDEIRIIDYFPILYAEQIPDGYEALVFTIHIRPCEGFFNGATDVDRLNREATDEFLRLTHERYKAKLGDMFGKEIMGIFVDEPFRGWIFGGNDMTRLPFTQKLFDVFKMVKGYDLKSCLPELYYPKAEYNKIALDYIAVLQQMFLDNFAKPYYEWCKKHNLIVTGHMFDESTLAGQTRLFGSAQRFYEYLDYPGIDVLADRDDTGWTAKQVASVARQLKKPFVLSELYGGTGWQYTFQNHKSQGDWQAVSGINFRCHHLSWYTMQGSAKRDYPASIFFQSAWHDKYSYVETYFSRLNYILSAGESITDVGIINPVESVWGMVRLGCFNYLNGVYPDIKKAQDDYVALYKAMTDGGVDFDYIDEDILARYGNLGNDILTVGVAKYKTVIVSGCKNVRGTTLDFLNKFVNGGGRVIVREAPEYVDGEKKNIDVSDFTMTENLFEVVNICRQNTAVKVTHPVGVIAKIRKTENDYFVALVNTRKQDEISNAEIIFDLPLNAEEWCARSGQILPCDFTIRDGHLTIVTSFAPSGERLFRLTKDSVAVFKKDVVKLTEYTLKVPTAFKYELSELNPFVLDTCRYYVDGCDEGENEILKIDYAVRKKFNMRFRGGTDIQPWFKTKYFGTTVEKTVCRLCLEYFISIQYVPEDDVFLALETPEKFDVTLNGCKVEHCIRGTYVDNSIYKLLLPNKTLKLGVNVLRLECDFSEDTNLEPIYLLGHFGVALTSKFLLGTKELDIAPVSTIIPLPKTLDCRALSEQGLPFYGGKIKFFTGIKGGNTDDLRLKLSFANIRGSYYEADFGGGDLEIIAFAPYKSRTHSLQGELTFTLCCSRRNTFGPLHYKKPVDASNWIGPESFVTEGDKFTLKHVLIDEGLNIPLITRGVQ